MFTANRIGGDNYVLDHFFHLFKMQLLGNIVWLLSASSGAIFQQCPLCKCMETIALNSTAPLKLHGGHQPREACVKDIQGRAVQALHEDSH